MPGCDEGYQRNTLTGDVRSQAEQSDPVRRVGEGMAPKLLFWNRPVFGQHPLGNPMRLLPCSRFPLLVSGVLLLISCASFQRVREEALPLMAELPETGQIPDSVLRRAIKRAELIVLATPMELVSQHGFLTPQFQLGAKETWYDVKLSVDSVLKGKLKRAKRPDFGALPAALTPPATFRLAKNEIVVQYPAVTARNSNWAKAPPLVPGERAVFLFRRCYYCLPISGLNTGRGPYYKANPLVVMSGESKLRPDEWPRIVRLMAEAQAARVAEGRTNERDDRGFIF